MRKYFLTVLAISLLAISCKSVEPNKAIILFGNLAWKNGGSEISEALIGKEVTLSCEIAGNVPDTEMIMFRIFSPGKNKDDLLDELEGQVQNGIVQADWEVSFFGGEGSNAEEEIDEQGYTIPNYYFVVQYGDALSTERSPLLTVRNVVGKQLVDEETGKVFANMRYSITLSDGTVISGVTDDDGYMETVYLKHFARVVDIVLN